MRFEIQIERANTWNDVIDKIENSTNYDIIVIDPMMSGTDGVGVLETIRGMGFTNSVVALVDDTIKTTDILLSKNGFSGIITETLGVHKKTAYLIRFIRARHHTCNILEW